MKVQFVFSTVFKLLNTCSQSFFFKHLQTYVLKNQIVFGKFISQILKTVEINML